MGEFCWQLKLYAAIGVGIIFEEKIVLASANPKRPSISWNLRTKNYVKRYVLCG